MGEQFQIRVEPWLLPLTWLITGTRRRPYVEITGEELIIRYGWLLTHEFSLTNAEGARLLQYASWREVDWRTTYAGTATLLGSVHNVVEIRLRSRVWVAMGLQLPRRCIRLWVPLEEPDRFIEALTVAIDEVQ